MSVIDKEFSDGNDERVTFFADAIHAVLSKLSTDDDTAMHLIMACAVECGRMIGAEGVPDALKQAVYDAAVEGINAGMTAQYQARLAGKPVLHPDIAAIAAAGEEGDLDDEGDLNEQFEELKASQARADEDEEYQRNYRRLEGYDEDL
jgi:hypothetical protein